ncbi:MAG: methyltransferase domain-containing protein [Gaiellaceae bacterium]
MAEDQAADARDREYCERLERLQHSRWKALLHVQAPYRWNLRRLEPGFTLEVGCGIGRNLAHLDGNAVGIDTNPYVVAAASKAGFRAFTPEEFAATEWNRAGIFDSLLLAHVAEHMRRDQLVELIRRYLPQLRPGGKLILITPQEAGFRTDSTHVELMDLDRLRGVSDELGLLPLRDFSFPFPRLFGRVFAYNEFVSVSRKP